MNAAPPSFTAAELASALGVTPRAVLIRLKQCPPDAPKKVRGQTAKAWTLAALPQTIRSELAAIAAKRHMGNVLQLFDEPSKPWQPAKPWHEISKAFQDRALLLCRALASALARQHDMSGPDLMALARVAYHQHFGHEIADDKLRYIMDRATKRDNNLGQWQRPDIYLDDAAFDSQRADPLVLNAIHAPLDEHAAAIKDRNQPTLADRAYLFHASFRHLETLAQSRPSKGEQRAAKASLVEYLYRNVPGLYRPQAAARNQPLLSLRSTFNLKYSQWVTGGRKVETLLDERAGKCGRKGYQHDPCEKLITAHAARLRGARGEQGNLDLAIKWLTEQNHLCANCKYNFAPHRLSKATRARLTPNALQVASFKGADALRKISPTHHCDWSDAYAGARFVTDDMTTNELTWDEVDGEVVSGQAQMLATEDEFSGYPLPFFLYFGAPNSHTIKLSLAAVLRHAGLPHDALITERGVYANRKLAGERNVQNRLDFRELEAAMESYFKYSAVPDDVLADVRKRDLGLRDPAFRLKILQARSPQAKSIERGFYEFQKNTSRLPGFAGFNQRNEKSRAMSDFDRRVSTGKEHPGNEYLHLSDLRKNYEVIFAEIASRPNNGMRCRGRSPLEVWKEAVDRNPLRKLPEEIEAHLSTHRLPSVKLDSKGLRVRLDKHETAFYFNDVTGALIHQGFSHVAVRVNYDIPEYIYLEHPKTGQLSKIMRAFTSRHNATSEQIATVNHARRAHVNGALGEIGNVTNLYTSHVIRDGLHSPSDMAKGAQITADVEQHKAEQSRTLREQKRNTLMAGALGAAISAHPRNQDRIREGLELQREAEADIAALKNTGNQESKKP